MPEAEAALRTLAHNVRAARTRAGLSLDELGRRAKVSKGALVGLEKAQETRTSPPWSASPTPSASRCPR